MTLLSLWAQAIGPALESVRSEIEHTKKARLTGLTFHVSGDFNGNAEGIYIINLMTSLKNFVPADANVSKSLNGRLLRL